MSDMEILDKYIDLDESCLSDSEKKQVMDILYKYKKYKDKNIRQGNEKIVLFRYIKRFHHLFKSSYVN